MFIFQNLPGTDAYLRKPAGDIPFKTGCSAHNSEQQRAKQCIHQTKY